MKKHYLLLALAGIMLVSCQGGGSSSPTSSSPSEVTTSGEENKLQAVLEGLKQNNFTTSYSLGNQANTYITYRSNDYFFDTYNQVGYIVLEDDTVYKFALYDNVCMPSAPRMGLRDEIFSPNFEPIDVDLESCEMVDDNIYQSTDIKVVQSFAHAANMTIYDSDNQVYLDTVNFYLDNNDNLKFAVYTINDVISLQGTIYDINKTSLEAADKFLEDGISPENIKTDDTSLKEIFGEGDFTFRSQVRDYVNGYQYQLVLGKDYYYYPSNGEGSMVLSDGYSHPFTLTSEGELTVDYEYDASEEYYRDLFSLRRVDYSKFYKVDDSTFLTRDYFNVSSLAFYLGLTSTDATTGETVPLTNADGLKIVINQDNSLSLTFYDDSSTAAEATLTDINSVAIEQIDNYLKSNLLPSLEVHENAKALDDAIQALDAYTIEVLDSSSFVEKIEIDQNGRYETWSYPLSRDLNYVKKGSNYYPFLVNGSSYEIDVTQPLSEEEYHSLLDLKSIDYSTFYYLGETDGRYRTDIQQHLDVLSNVFTVSSYSQITAAYITLNDDGSITFSLQDGSLLGGGELLEYTLTSMESSSTLTNVVNSFDDSLLDLGDHTPLVNFFNKLNEEQNFRVRFLSGEGDSYTEEDDDFYTKETYYSGYFKDGLYLTPSGYIYEFRESYVDSETGDTIPFQIGSHPLNATSIYESTNLPLFTEEVLNTFKLTSQGFETQNSYYIDLICGFLYMDSTYIDKMIFSIVDDELHIRFETREYTQDESGLLTNAYEYTLFAEVNIIDVGSTVIPEDAVLPEKLK